MAAGLHAVVCCLMFIISCVFNTSATRCKGPVWGDECLHECHCSSINHTCQNHNAVCGSEVDGCEYGFGGLNCLMEATTRDRPPVTMNGAKFFPGTGTELKELTGDRVVDLNEATDLSWCALAYRMPNTPPLTLMIDLQKPRYLYAITLLGADFDHPLKSHLKLEVDGATCIDRNMTYAPPQKEEIKCEYNTRGRVLLLTSRHQMIKMCEVLVWECAPGTYGPRCARQCRCKDPSEECNRFTGRCRSGCRIAHRQNDCQERNVALGRPCFTPRPRPPTNNIPEGHADYLTDGLNPDNNISFCTETAFGANGLGWVEVDLGSPHVYVKSVVIHGHTRKQNRLDGLEVLVLRPDETQVEKYLMQTCGRSDSRRHSSLPSVVIHCDVILQGSRIRIARFNPQPPEDVDLTICEVEVWECADGTFGDKCQRTCNCHDPAEVCHKMTGSCKSSGCAFGFQPASGCLTACPPNMWGRDCKQQCHCFEQSAVCRPTDGNCSLGCAPGWSGPGCSIPCTPGTFGMNCAFECQGCLNNTCDPVSGVCRGCKLNTDGVTCQEKCEAGYFGRNCWIECGQCKNENEVCHEVTGACVSGCAPNVYGINCQIIDRTRDFLVTAFDHTGKSHGDVLNDANGAETCVALDSAAVLTGRPGSVIVQLTKTVYINRIIMKGKGGSAHGLPFTVTVDNVICAAKVEMRGPSIEIRCDKPTKGQLVKISRPDPFELCEVQVWECNPYMWGLDCLQECNCYSSAEECDRNTGQCSGECPKNFKGLSCQTKNVAFLKSVQQSSVFYYDQGRSLQYPHHAVDGVLDNSPGHCAVTQNGSEAWWEVDLMKPTFVHSITIFNERFATYYAMNLKVSVDDQPCYERTLTSQRPPLVEEIFCTVNRRGRRIRFTHPTQVRLCEVQVWECVDGAWGMECDNACKCEDENEICNKFDGSCKARVYSEGQGGNLQTGGGALSGALEASCGHCVTVSWSLLISLSVAAVLQTISKNEPL